jgi:hypothetical protein
MPTKQTPIPNLMRVVKQLHGRRHLVDMVHHRLASMEDTDSKIKTYMKGTLNGHWRKIRVASSAF